MAVGPSTSRARLIAAACERAAGHLQVDLPRPRPPGPRPRRLALPCPRRRRQRRPPFFWRLSLINLYLGHIVSLIICAMHNRMAFTAQPAVSYSELLINIAVVDK
jgi:hypothetical protein